MAFVTRRVVTGHDAAGRAVVQIDDVPDNVVSRRAGHRSSVLWSTEAVPADVADPTDRARVPVGTSLPQGTVFRISEMQPGVAPRMHRTDSIDYALVLSGAVWMELDDGVEVELRAGDALVQRATIHNWINRGTEPCVMAFVLVGATPPIVGGETLAPEG
jgi:quercetin dioxygenase-like cupin family protein